MIIKYSTIDDFIFSNLQNAMEIQRSGNLTIEKDSIPGFTLICFIIANICRISYVSVVSLPLLAPTLILVLIAIISKLMNKLSSPIFVISIAGIWILYFGTRPTLFCHTIGIALFFNLLLMSIIRIKANSTANSISISSLMLIILLSINLYSYKLMFFTITFLMVLHLFLKFKNLRSTNKSSIQGLKFTNFIVVGIILALSFNWIFYRGFLPAFITNYDSPFSGIERYFSFLSPIHDSVLSEYLFKGSNESFILYLFLYIMLIFSLIAIFYTTCLKIIKKRALSTNDIILGALILAGFIIFIVYSPLGYVELTFLLTAGLFGYVILLESNFKSSKIISLIVYSLVITTILMNALATVNHDFGGQSDDFEFEYLGGPSKWYVSHFSDNMPITSSDQLTRGYVIMEAQSSGYSITEKIRPFSKESILFILNPNNTIDYNLDDVIIINYKEPSFVINGWDRIKSWSNYQHNIRYNNNLNVVYTSSSIDVCTSVKA